MALSPEKKVGFFFILCLLIFGLMLELGEKWNPFRKNVPYHTFLGSTTGLKIGDSVRLAGVEVGKINDIALADNRVRIDFEVAPGTAVKTDSVATIRLTNLLGGQFLGLSFGSKEAGQLPPGSTVSSREIANIDIIVDNVSELAKDARSLVNNLNSSQQEVVARLNALVDENRLPLRNSVANLDSITTKMNSGDGTLARLLNDRVLYADASAAATGLREMTDRIKRGEGSLGRLMQDESLYRDSAQAVQRLNDGMKQVNEIASKINRGEGSMGKLVNDESLYVELRDASRNVREVTAKINSGEGTLGKLVNDDKLYRDATATLKKADKAVEGLNDTGPVSVLGSIIGTLF